MNNHEAATRIIEEHRIAGRWTNDAVADDLLAQLGLDPAGEAKNAKPVIVPGITEDEVVAHETAAKEARDKAKAARAAFEAQRAEEHPSLVQRVERALGMGEGDDVAARLTEQRAASDAEVDRKRQMSMSATNAQQLPVVNAGMTDESAPTSSNLGHG